MSESAYLSQLDGLQSKARDFAFKAAKLKIKHDSCMDIIRKIA